MKVNLANSESIPRPGELWRFTSRWPAKGLWNTEGKSRFALARRESDPLPRKWKLQKALMPITVQMNALHTSILIEPNLNPEALHKQS